jgi:hypothetical protein
MRSAVETSKALTLTLCAILVLSACSDGPIHSRPRAYVGYPEKIDPQCRDGKARMFDECGDQVELLGEAQARAKADGKVLLVEFGSEWCIWCHVFESHINGDTDRFRYTYGSPHEPDVRHTTTFEEGEWADARAAEELRSFVAASFVIVHIDVEYAPNGFDVLKQTGALEHFEGGIPFVFTVDEGGRFAAKFDHDSVERRRDDAVDWYRGYDRRGLLKALAAMRDMAKNAR